MTTKVVGVKSFFSSSVTSSLRRNDRENIIGEVSTRAPFRCQKFYQNFQIPRHIESLNTCMKH
jgi:hypothetical protein